VALRALTSAVFCTCAS